jgi:hypothetical protein
MQRSTERVIKAYVVYRSWPVIFGLFFLGSTALVVLLTFVMVLIRYIFNGVPVWQ